MNDNSEPSFAQLEASLARENSGFARIRSWSFAARVGLLFACAAMPVLMAFWLSPEWQREGAWAPIGIALGALAVGLFVAASRLVDDPALKLLDPKTTRARLGVFRSCMFALAAVMLMVHLLHDAPLFGITYACGAMSVMSGLLSGFASFWIARRPSWITSSVVGLLVALSSLEVACGEFSAMHRAVEHVAPLLLVFGLLRVASARQRSA